MTGPLRIALALDDSLDRPDGVQQHVLALGRWLAARGHDVHYLAPSTTRADLPNLWEIGSSVEVRANGNVLRTPTVGRTARLRSVLADVRPDVLHVALPCSPLLAGRLTAQVPASTAVVGTFHILPGGPVMAAASRLLGMVQARQLRRFDEVMAVSAPAGDFARRAFGLETSVVPNPVDVSTFATVVPRPRTTDRVQVLYLGRLVERKGARHLVRAVGELKARGLSATPFEVTIAGRGPMLDQLRAQVVREGLDGSVRFSGFVPEEAKAELLANADVVALPSVGGESFGISVVEALAASRGVVLAGDNPGYRAAMGGLTDQLVQPQDAVAFARTLATYLDRPDLRQRARERQLAQARTFDTARVGPQVLAVYEQALARRRSRVEAPLPA